MADELDDAQYAFSDASRSPSPSPEVDAGGVTAAAPAGGASDAEEPAFDDDVAQKGAEGMSEKERLENKKRKRKEREKARKARKNEARASMPESAGPGVQPQDMQADFLAKVWRQTKLFAKSSEMELDEVCVREAMLLDTTRFTTERSIDALAPFVRHVLPSLSKLLSSLSAPLPQPGTPSLLVVTGNAQRAADLSRGLRPLLPRIQEEEGTAKKRRKVDEEGEAKGEKGEERLHVGKLFARHFKLKEHVEWLRAKSMPVAAGTPARLLALLAPPEGSEDSLAAAPLRLDELRLIVLDVSWRDSKNRGICEGPETREELVRLLSDERVRERLVKQGTRIAIF